MSSQVSLPVALLERRLLADVSLAKTQLDTPSHVHRITHAADIPSEGSLVAIDAEFVSLAKEEAEIRSEGYNKKSTLKPAHMCVCVCDVVVCACMCLISLCACACNVIASDCSYAIMYAFVMQSCVCVCVWFRTLVSVCCMSLRLCDRAFKDM